MLRLQLAKCHQVACVEALRDTPAPNLGLETVVHCTATVGVVMSSAGLGVKLHSGPVTALDLLLLLQAFRGAAMLLRIRQATVQFRLRLTVLVSSHYQSLAHPCLMRVHPLPRPPTLRSQAQSARSALADIQAHLRLHPRL